MDLRKLISGQNFKPLGNDELLETAYHEAGHALIDLLFGFPVGHVSIFTNGESKGRANSIPFSKYDNGDAYQTYALQDMPPGFFEKLEPEHYAELWYCGLLAGGVAGAMYSGKWDDVYTGHDIQIMFEYDSYLRDDLTPYINKTIQMLSVHKQLL